MKRYPLTAFLSISAILLLGVFANPTAAQEDGKEKRNLSHLINNSVTITTNPHNGSHPEVKGTLLGIDEDGVLVQTSKTKVWVPTVSILMIESP
ncbi:MAG: hypothetical protein COA70_08705 [Planctomycetota bacterium]|nr:MAG: hypothetical protein COA70_08705 [Planctomycetota bacterium]